MSAINFIATKAIPKIQGALATSQTVWLPGQKEIQSRLPAARNDHSFRTFLRTLDGSTEQPSGTTEFNDEGRHGTL
jgi:hypothetical protein